MYNSTAESAPDAANEVDNYRNKKTGSKRLSTVATIGIVISVGILAMVSFISTIGAPKESKNMRRSLDESTVNVQAEGEDVHSLLSKTFAPSPVTFVMDIASHTRNPTLTPSMHRGTEMPKTRAPVEEKTHAPIEEKTFSPTPANFQKITFGPTPTKFDHFTSNPTTFQHTLAPTPSDLLPKDGNSRIQNLDTVDSKPGENKDDANFSISRKTLETLVVGKGKAPTPSIADDLLILTRNPTPATMQTRNPTPVLKTKSPVEEVKTLNPTIDKTLNPTEEKTLNPTPVQLGVTLNPTPAGFGKLTLNPTPSDYYRTDNVEIINNHKVTDADEDEEVTKHEDKDSAEDIEDSEDEDETVTKHEVKDSSLNDNSPKRSSSRSSSRSDSSLKATTTATGTVLKKSQQKSADKTTSSRSSSRSDSSLKATTTSTGTELKKKQESSEDKTVHSSKQSS